MKIKNFLIIFTLFMVLLCGVSAISAASDNAVDNLTSGMDDSISVSNDEKAIGVVDENSALKAQENDDEVNGQPYNDENNKMTAESSKIIYVGHHNTTLYGNGSYENPFSNFKSACDSVNGEKNVTLNIFGGTYYMGENLGHQEFLKFNTSNLNIIGINGTVIITYLHNEKIEYTDVQTTYAEAFELASADANITISNIIFNATGCVRTALLLEGNYDYFFPFYGKTNLAVFNNCSFIGFDVPRITGAGYNSKFIKCYFNILGSFLFYDQFAKNTYHVFEYCIFDKDVQYLKKINLPCEITIDNCWFGQNSLPRFITPPKAQVMQNGKQVSGYVIPVSRYAVLSVSYNYLGDNRFEIAGQFTWNGTNDTDGMDNFQPMDVIFETTTGSVNKTVTLVNGSFSTIYTSNSNENELFVTLINEEFNFKFNTTDVVIDAPSIYYGDDQNITVNFSQIVNSTVNITVNNKTYSVKVNESDSFTYTIEDVLTEGNYVVDVVLIDEENHLYGSNSTILSVSKVSNYEWDYSIPSDVVYGQNATIIITLPKDVSGNIIVVVGNDTKKLSANETISVDFTDLNADTYPVTISYNGSDKYASKEVTDSLTVNPAQSGIEINDAIFTFGDVIAIPFNVTNANGITVSVLNKDDDEVATGSGESNVVALDALPAGEYTLYAKTVVDSNYEWVDATINLTINKADSSLKIFDKEFAYAAEAVINALCENSTGDVIATLADENNTEIAVTVTGDSITLPKLNTGKYTLTVTTNPDENHTNTTKSATITITKTTPSMNVIVAPAKNITAKDNVTLTIKLPADATGEVTVKINGKKTEIRSANETMAINLNNQAGDYVVDVTYSGDKNYENDMASQEYTVSKAETSITAKQIDFDEGNASKIEVTAPDIESGIVLVDVAGKKFYGDIKSGKASITLEGVDAGNYTVNIKFFGDDIYKEATTTADVKVSEPKIITELKEQLEEAQANATQLKDELDNVSDQLVDARDNATQLKEDLDELNQTVAGKDAEISNLTDVVSGKDAEISNLTDVVSGKDAKIAELYDTVNTKDSTKTIQELKDQVGSLNATVVSQIATIEAQKKRISSLNDTVNTKDSTKTIQELKDQVGSLNATVVSQNATIEAQTKEIDDLKTNVGPLTKKDTKLVVAKTFTRVAVDYKAGERGGMFYAILKDSDGNVLANKTVHIAINGKIYKKTTNNQGRVGIRVNFANANTYSYAISFQGDDTYNAAPMASSKLTVIKKKTAIRASNKVFNAKTETKKISVILKTVKNKYNKKTYLKSGKKVTLKVNGKTYIAKINKKGVAKFTIKITKEGKYTAKIKFAGDRTYKASSKTIIIRIK